MRHQGAIMLTPRQRFWECPNCGTRAVTNLGVAHTEFHHCPTLRYLSAPLVETTDRGLKQRLHLRALPRGDYLNGDIGQRTNIDGTPIMAVHTERGDGSHDTHVFPAMAQADPIEKG
jgi:hypothetical protein